MSSPVVELAPAPARRLGVTLLGAVGVMLWASETTLITFTTAIPPIQTVALAFGFAALLTPLLWVFSGADPLAAFRQPPRVWAWAVASLVGYHAAIYYATQNAPPAPAALLQGTTPLLIVLGSAFLPGERLSWWHVAGAVLGFMGILLLIERGGAPSAMHADATFYLALIGVAAGLWGLYSVVSRLMPDVPSSALGMFYLASAVCTGTVHAGVETWVTPDATELLAIAGLGVLPMGLAIFFWDCGVKHGDIQALGAFAYVEPFIGAVLVALFTGTFLQWELLWSGALVIGGAVLASASLWSAPGGTAGP
jgi:drug/metabolite transporter (DMT)-like permease